MSFYCSSIYSLLVASIIDIDLGWIVCSDSDYLMRYLVIQCAKVLELNAIYIHPFGLSIWGSNNNFLVFVFLPVFIRDIILSYVSSVLLGHFSAD